IPFGDLARLTDGDPSTGLKGRGTQAVTLPLALGEQPGALTIGVTSRLSGAVTMQTVNAAEKATGPQVTVEGLASGWHTVPLNRLAPGAAVRVTWNAGREGAGLLSELRLTSSPLPDDRGRAIRVSYPLHGECVDHQAYVRGFVTGTGAA